MVPWLILLACAPDGGPTPVQPSEAPVDLLGAIDPFIGSGGFGFQVGSGMPGATLPFGHVRLSPDTADHMGSYPGFHRGGGYHADDTLLRAFSHTHLHGVGLTDYGAVGVVPVDGLQSAAGGSVVHEDNRRPELLAQRAWPGRFEADLANPEVSAVLTATARTGLHRYTFAEGVAEPTLLVDLAHVNGSGECLDSAIQWSEDGRSLWGWRTTEGEMIDRYTVWFAAELQQAPEAWGTLRDTTLDGKTRAVTDSLSATGPGVGAWARFAEREVALRVAVSVVDQEGAWANLAAEHDGFDVDEVSAEALAAWEELLAPVRVWGGTAEEQVIFASSLYKSAIMPSAVEDVDGRYRGFDGETHQGSHPFLSDMSLWDTYRTTHPLYTLLWPEHHRDMLRSLSTMGREGGNLPRWPMATSDGGFMVGTPAHIVGGEAWQKGLRDWDEEAFLEVALVESLTDTEPLYGGRPDPTLVDTYGYYPADEIGRSVAWLQENAVADAALAPMAAALTEVPGAGAEAAAHLEERSGTWANVYDPAIGWAHGRLADGSFDEFEGDGLWLDEYAEGNARQYLWMVPHDPEGLVEVLGGEAAALERLDELFENTVDAEDDWAPGTPEPWYWHGNEPDIHAAFTYVFAGSPADATRWVRWIMETRYSTEPDGLWGNDDGGTLSAWYVWAAMGIYPLAGTDRYVLVDPVFDRVELDREDGVFVVERLGEGELAEVRLDGELLDPHTLTHDQLRGGSVLSFVGADAR